MPFPALPTVEPRAGEFEITRATPNQDECDRAAEGEIVMLKQWDLSPVDPSSFDPTEPPGRPASPPTNSVPPQITPVGGLTVGEMLAVTSGTWTGSPTYARQWRRGATNIPGATTTGYTLVADDVGQMISCNVTATNAGGSASALSNAVGPIEEAAAEPEPPNGDDEEPAQRATTRRNQERRK